MRKEVESRTKIKEEIVDDLLPTSRSRDEGEYARESKEVKPYGESYRDRLRREELSPVRTAPKRELYSPEPAKVQKKERVKAESKEDGQGAGENLSIEETK